MTRIIGISAENYPEKRNFSALNIPGYQHKKYIDLYKIPAYIFFKWKKKTHRRWLNLFWRPFSFFSGVKGYHFFNTINRGNQPWVVTYEYYLPRGAQQIGQFENEKKYIEWALKRIAHPSCKKLIALSEYARISQINYLKTLPELAASIIPKIVVAHPPQVPHLQNIHEKVVNEKLTFVMVGADFFRKGGYEVITVFNKLAEELNLKLTIVSSMQFGDYASGATMEDLQYVKNIISKNPAIELFSGLPNEQVLSLFRNADIGLLPSYDETYGYSVLESQACGCPVITTNGGAFNEINNSEIGWLIELPLDKDHRTVARTPETRVRYREILIQGLERVLREISNNQEQVKVKGQKCIEHIRQKHNPEKAALFLKGLYDTF